MRVLGKALVVVCFAAVAACEQVASPMPSPDVTPTQAPSPGGSDIVGIASVVDGDTIDIHGQRIRIHGVDSPERGATCGDVNVYQSAALALTDYIATQTVMCTPNGSDGNRIVAICRVGGVDVAEYMTEQGWSRDWPRYSQRAYADEEAEARSERRGIWGMQCPADLWGTRNYD